MPTAESGRSAGEVRARASGRRLCYHGCGRFFRSQDEKGRGVHAELYCRGARGIPGVRVRYLAGRIPLGRDWGFPVRTLAINLIGSFLIGAVTALALKRAAPDPRLVLFLKAGVCGGFTTFSSFALETGDLLKSGHTAAALLYAAASLVLGVAAVFAGEAAVR